MKTSLLSCFLLAVLLPGCVQKTYRKTVVYTLHIPGTQPPATVGIRGKDKPLNWESDATMNRSPTDSLTYRAVVTYQTGYLFTEVKFVAGGVFELGDQPNRRVVFAATDTTFYDATFDKLNPVKTN